MLLKSLNISGFKSFARPTRLDFPPGITALVGPNGSGKSNVVDAVRWSLGEQSARDLRGQRSEDVIYAGARKVLGAAEVVLDFEAVPGMHSDRKHGLSISRRLYRSGDSEYLVDGRRVRLRDVIHELSAVGVDAGRHIIVTQGMADALLSAGPAERRMLLEQAAGLSVYRQRREEARHKLSTIGHNIETVELVLQELEPRVRLLHRQARAMEERDEAIRRLHERLLQWHAGRFTELNAEREKAAACEQDLARQRIAHEAHVTQLEQTYQAALQSERTWQKQLESEVYALHQAERDRDAQTHALELLEQRHAEFDREKSRLQIQLARSLEDQHAARKRISEAQGALEAAERDKLERSTIVQRLRTARTEAESRLRNAENTVANRQREVAYREQEELRAARRTVECKNQLETKLSESHRINYRVQELQVEAASLKVRRDAAKIEYCKCADRVRHIADQLDCEKYNAGILRSRNERLARVRARATRLLATTQHELDTTRSRLGALLGDQPSALLDFLRVPAGYEQAVAAALSVWTHAGLDRSSPSALHTGDMRAFLLWRETLQIPSNAGTWLDALVTDFPRTHVNPLSATLLVTVDADAESIWTELNGQGAGVIGWPEIQIVTREGRLLNAIGVRSNLRLDAAEYFAMKRNYERRGRWLDVQRSRLRRLETLAAETEADLEQSRGDVRHQEEQWRIAASEMADSEAMLQRIQRALSRNEDEYAHIANDVEQLTGETASARAARDAAENDLRQMNESSAKARSALTIATAAAHESRKDVASLADQQMEEERLGVVLTARATSAAETMRSAEERLRQLATGDADYGRRLHLVEVTGEQIAGDLESCRVSLAHVNEICIQRQSTVDATKNDRPVPVHPDDDLQRARVQMSDTISRHERALAHFSQAEDAFRRWQEEALSELEVEAFILPETVDNPPTGEEIRRLRARAGQYADLDESVIEEWKCLDERQTYLQAQVHDLVEAADELREIMRVSDEEMERRFRIAFDAVNQEFSRVFQLMLRGGVAQLELVGDEQSVDINAQLPGRRSRSSAAFSGGERSLVALSLLFGVLRIKPAPFCILDEVDAALDENNVDRYLAVLRDLSESTQMIVVTHNRATMAAADVLYGLTMDDAGISSVLSLRLDQYKAG